MKTFVNIWLKNNRRIWISCSMISMVQVKLMLDILHKTSTTPLLLIRSVTKNKKKEEIDCQLVNDATGAHNSNWDQEFQTNNSIKLLIHSNRLLLKSRRFKERLSLTNSIIESDHNSESRIKLIVIKSFDNSCRNLKPSTYFILHYLYCCIT